MASRCKIASLSRTTAGSLVLRLLRMSEVQFPSTLTMPRRSPDEALALCLDTRFSSSTSSPQCHVFRGNFQSLSSRVLLEDQAEKRVRAPLCSTSLETWEYLTLHSSGQFAQHSMAIADMRRGRRLLAEPVKPAGSSTENPQRAKETDARA